MAVTYSVTNTSNAGSGSLREAIDNANLSPGLDSISFAILGSGPHVISLISRLPDITSPVTIDVRLKASVILDKMLSFKLVLTEGVEVSLD